MNILLYFKNSELTDFFTAILNAHRYEVHSESIFEDALGRFLKKNYQLVFIENNLGTDGYNFCRILKLNENAPKIIAVSFPNREHKAFISEANENIEYPCEEKVIMTLIQKYEQSYPSELEKPLILGDLELHTSTYEASRAGKKIALRKKEYQLLEFMLRNKNRVINRHTILEYIWNYDTSAITNTLDVHIASLRKKIDHEYPQKMIQTIYGAGYKLSDH